MRCGVRVTVGVRLSVRPPVCLSRRYQPPFHPYPPERSSRFVAARAPRCYRAALGIRFQSPYSSHPHSKTCGNLHRIRIPTEPRNPPYAYRTPCVFSLDAFLNKHTSGNPHTHGSHGYRPFKNLQAPELRLRVASCREPRYEAQSTDLTDLLLLRPR